MASYNAMMRNAETWVDRLSYYEALVLVGNARFPATRINKLNAQNLIRNGDYSIMYTQGQGFNMGGLL